MKKIITALFAIAVFTFSATAQSQDTEAKQRDQYKGHHGKEMEKLNLTEAQRQQMKSINGNFKTRMQALNKTDNNYKEQKKALMKERKDKVSAILSPEQKNQVKQMRKEHKGEWKEKRNAEDGKEKRKIKTT